MRKIFVLAVIGIIAFLGYNYVYHGHRNIESETAEYSLTAIEIQKQFVDDPNISQQKYLNKTIEISGWVSEKSEKEITVDESAFCQFSTQIDNNISLHSKIKIKGRFIGYDDLLEQVKLDQCIIN